MRRLRPAHDAATLASIYAQPHDANRWEDHRQRVAASIAFIEARSKRYAGTIADLSCGNGAIARGVAFPDDTVILGDFAPGYDITGPIEQTIDDIPHVDLFICSETLEHVDDPALVLGKIRADRKSVV